MARLTLMLRSRELARLRADLRTFVRRASREPFGKRRRPDPLSNRRLGLNQGWTARE